MSAPEDSHDSQAERGIEKERVFRHADRKPVQCMSHRISGSPGRGGNRRHVQPLHSSSAGTDKDRAAMSKRAIEPTEGRPSSPDSQSEAARTGRGQGNAQRRGVKLDTRDTAVIEMIDSGGVSNGPLALIKQGSSLITERKTRKNFTRFAEVFDHLKASNDRFSDLRHDDAPQVNPKAG